MQRKLVAGIAAAELINGSNPKLSKAIRWLSVTVVATAAFAVITLAADSATFGVHGNANEGNGNVRWVGTWGAALHEPDLGIPGLANTGFNNQTLREIV